MCLGFCIKVMLVYPETQFELPVLTPRNTPYAHIEPSKGTLSKEPYSNC